MEVHETEQARADLDEAIRLAPINAVYYDNRGLLLRRLGCYADASKDYLRARWIRSGKYRVHNGVVEALRGDDGSIDDMCTGDALVPLVNATGTTGATGATGATGGDSADSTADATSATSAPPSDAADSGGGAGSSSDNDTATSSTTATTATAATAATPATVDTSAMDNVEEKYAEDNERATSLLRAALRSKPGDRGEAMVQLLADKSDAVAYLRRFPIPVLKEMWR